MRVTELMVGDWVKWMGKPCKIDIPLLHTEFSGKEFNDSKYVEPIPLTPDILEKNGCVYDYDDDICVADYSFISVKGYQYIDNEQDVLIDYCNGKIIICKYYDEVKLCEIKYVHELQHALRLCGIEKEIII